jgi:sialate O-acetylesterase
VILQLPPKKLLIFVIAYVAGGVAVPKHADAADALFTLLKGLADCQVFQRSATDTVTIAMEGVAPIAGNIAATVSAEGKALEAWSGVQIGSATGGSWQAVLSGLPMGGPYTIRLVLAGPAGSPTHELNVKRVLVGDLWLLGGQSNMQGIGDMVGVEEPSDRVNVFRMRHMWDEAREPIHRLYESVDRVHRGDAPMPSTEESDKMTSQQTKGAGLGLPFAKQMVARTGVPIGLVPVGHGGTSMDQWSPAKRDMGGDSLYGSFLSSLKATGGKVRGMLWYQGESDAVPGEASATAFAPKLAGLVEAIRQDTGDPNLPFYFVQIGCFANTNPVIRKGWNIVQEAQRHCEETIPNSGLVASVDLALDDGIHIGTEGLKRLGKRLTNLALGGPSRGPRLDRVERAGLVLRVVFKGGVKLMPNKGRVSGFSIRTPEGEDTNLIFKQLVDPADASVVLLHLTEEPPEGSQLWYGYGLIPFCNLTDNEDMAAPVMGPLAIPKP